MKIQKKVVLPVVIILVVFGLLYIIQSMNTKKANEQLAEPNLKNGLLVDGNVTEKGIDYVIPPDRIFDFGVDVPEITDPKYINVKEADEILADGLPGVSINVNDVYYFYPIQILNWHQVVSASFPNLQLTITHDPLCLSSRVYQASELVHSGKVYDNNALLKSENGDLYRQGTGEGVSGSAIGSSLADYPFESILWSEWKELHPEGLVLSSDTGYIRDYTQHPYGVAYDEGDYIYFPMSSINEDYASKWEIDGVIDGEKSAAFIRDVTKGFGVENGELNGTAYVGLYDFDQQRTRVYRRNVDNQILTFTYNFDKDEWRDEQTNSLWNADGEAIDGEMEGTKLQEVQTFQSFWFCWNAQHNDTAVGHADTIDVESDEGIDIDIGNIQ